MMKEFWAKVAHFYGKTLDLEEKQRVFLIQFLKNFSKEKIQNSRILELGCGNGAFLVKIFENEIPFKEVIGVDYSEEMLFFCKKRLTKWPVKLIHSDIFSFLKRKDMQKFDFVIILNTLHNLPGKEKIERVLREVTNFVMPGGYLIFDIRNKFNPFLNYGYRVNRKKGLNFYTFSIFETKRILKENGFSIKETIPIYYKSLHEAPKKSFIYWFYLKFISIFKIFSPYFLVISQKAQYFISTIWGYHNQLPHFSKIENYHLMPLEVAKECGFTPVVFLIKSSFDITRDPNFSKEIKVVKYKNIFHFLFFLIKFRDSIFYVNTFIWQSFLVPFICRKTIFMGHDSVKRKTKIKQIIQDIVFNYFFKRIRVISNEEKQFLISRGCPASKIFVIPLAVDIELFQEKKLGLRNNIVFLGNVTPDKNISIILKAIALIKNEFPDIKLVIYGEIRDKNFYPLVKKLNLENQVIVRGFIPHTELPQELNRYLIYVNSSISEGQCLSAFECALCGVALCLPKTLSFFGVFKEKALFHEINDFKGLAENIKTYLKNEELRKNHVKLCQKMIKKEYNYQKISEEFKNLLLQL